MYHKIATSGKCGWNYKKIKFHTGLTITVTPPYNLVYTGGRIGVHCGGGNNVPVIWSKNGVQVPKINIAMNNMLVISNIDFKHGGTYTCKESHKSWWKPQPKARYRLYVGSKYRTTLHSIPK